MKKLFVLLIAIFTLIPVVSAKEKVTVSVFYLESCIHCQHLHEYLDNLVKDPVYGEMFNIDYYEVSDSENSNLYFKVRTYLKNSSSGVPFYVIGNTYEVGFPNPNNDSEQGKKLYNETTDNIKQKIENAYNNSEKNIVKDIKDGVIEVKTTERTTTKANIVKEEKNYVEETNKKTNNTKYFIFAIIPVAFILVLIIILIRKKKA